MSIGYFIANDETRELFELGNGFGVSWDEQRELASPDTRDGFPYSFVLNQDLAALACAVSAALPRPPRFELPEGDVVAGRAAERMLAWCGSSVVSIVNDSSFDGWRVGGRHYDGEVTGSRYDSWLRHEELAE